MPSPWRKWRKLAAMTMDKFKMKALLLLALVRKCAILHRVTSFIDFTFSSLLPYYPIIHDVSL